MSTVYIDDLSAFPSSLQHCWEEVHRGREHQTASALIKPNFINDLSSERGVTTSLELIDRVIDFLREKGVTSIALAEASITDTREVFENLGIFQFEKKQVKILNLEEGERKTVAPPAPLNISRFSVPRVIDDYELIINMPKMKTHELTGATLGLKNCFAFFSNGGRRYAHLTHIDKSIVDMFSYVQSQVPVITIVDGLTAMSGRGGPVKGEPLDLGLVLSGCDTVAVDATAAIIMGGDPALIEHISLAARQGLGKADHITCLGSRPLEVSRQFVFPGPYTPFKTKLLRIKNWIFRKRPGLQKPSNCVQCLACVNICPKRCIHLNDNVIQIDEASCINCFCCCEACKYDALGVGVRFERIYQCLLQVKKLLGR